VSRLSRQVTLCYKARKRRYRAVSRASNTVLLALVCAAAVGCGSSRTPSGNAPVLLHAGDLPGWRAVPDAPGIEELAPDLSGLHVTGSTDSPALVHAGDVVRATALVFVTDAEADEALARAKAAGYAPGLEKAFRGTIVGRTAGPRRIGYRLTVPRPAEPGRDTAELYVLRRGRTIALVEFVSAAGFDPALRSQILARISR
jgi:hypothetical protein